MNVGVRDPDAAFLYRVGGISALVLGIGYIVIIPLYVSVGVPPSGGEAWLTYGAGKSTVWWAILGLSVLTDFLYLPVAIALYFALRAIDRNAALFAAAFLGMFVVLDLAVTWPNIALLITLSDRYGAATIEAQRAAFVASADYASTVLKSTLEGVYAIVIPALGILLFGVVMRRGIFGRPTAYLGISAGILAIVSVVGPFVVSGLAQAVIAASALTTIWFLLVGYRLYRLT